MFSFNPHDELQGIYYRLHFIDMEIEAQGGDVACLGSHSL